MISLSKAIALCFLTALAIPTALVACVILGDVWFYQIATHGQKKRPVHAPRRYGYEVSQKPVKNIAHPWVYSAVVRYFRYGQVVNAEQFVNLLAGDSRFRETVVRSLKEAGGPRQQFSGYYLRAPVLDHAARGKPFFWVLKDSKWNQAANHWKFANQLKSSHAVQFPSYDATPTADFEMVCPQLPQNMHSKSPEYRSRHHISEFTQNAKMDVQLDFWSKVAQMLKKRFAQHHMTPFLAQTHGKDVHYLHFRMEDKTPSGFRYAKDFPGMDKPWKLYSNVFGQ